MTISDFLQSRINAKGWLSLINIYFDNGLVFNPHTADGYLCISPSLKMFIALNKIDTVTTDAVEKGFLVQDNKYVDLQQVITVVGLEFLQHVDINLFAQQRMYTDDMKEFPLPKVPTVAEMMAYDLDPDTKLAAGTDTACLMDGREVSVVSLYNGKRYEDYVGLRIEPYQQWEKKHTMFCKAMNTLLGVSDCI